MPAAPAAPPPSAPAAPAAAPAAPKAPAAPPPKAAAPAAPAAPPVKAAKPVSQPAKDIGDAFAQLDKLAGEGVEDSFAKNEPQPPKNAKPQDSRDRPGQPPGETPPAAPEPGEPAKPPGEKGTPPKAATMREALETSKRELTLAKARIAELEKSSTTPKDDPDRVKLTETLAQREKRLQELEDEVRFTNFERSTEYKEKYEQPFIDAYAAGQKKIASLTAIGQDGTPRQATAADWDAIMRAPDDNAAAEMATELFGNKASIVLFHREQVHNLNATRINAIDNFRKEGGVREQQRTEQQKKHAAELNSLFESETKSAAEKHPKWFAPEEGDARGNELLTEGMALADMAFSGTRTDPETGKQVRLTPQELTKVHAAIRNKAGAFDRLAYRNSQLRKQLKEAQEALKAFEGSEPGPGNGGGKGGAAAGGSSMEQVLAKLGQ